MGCNAGTLKWLLAVRNMVIIEKSDVFISPIPESRLNNVWDITIKIKIFVPISLLLYRAPRRVACFSLMAILASARRSCLKVCCLIGIPDFFLRQHFWDLHWIKSFHINVNQYNLEREREREREREKYYQISVSLQVLFGPPWQDQPAFNTKQQCSFH